MTLKRVFHYFWNVIRQYKTAFFSLFFFYSGRTLFSIIIGGYIYKLIIDTLGNSELTVDSRYQITLILVVSAGMCFLISAFMSRWGDYIYYRFLARATKNVYDFTFARLSQHSYSFFTNNFTGTLVNRVKKFAQAFDTMVDLSLNNFWPILVILILSTATLSLQSKPLAIYFFIWSVLYGIIMALFVKKKFKVDLKWNETDSKVTGFLSDSILNILNLKIFSAFQKENNTFREISTELKTRAWASYKIHMFRSAMQAFLMITFHTFILFAMVTLWRSGEITIGVFVMTYAYMMNIFDRMWDLSSSLTRFLKAATDAKEMIDILDKALDIKDPELPEKMKITNGEIEFKDVHFEYIQDLAVFDDFSLKIKAGEKVGLVGHSGSGKSTITKMLLRFTDVKNGTIKIDGQEITSITQDDLRSKISYVPQDPILFHRSILENISYARPEASREQVEVAAKKAHAHEFISKLQHGYDTLVGERGVKLSGGERQRVAIARAMLKDAPILVLDEATSSLDSVSESYIQDAFGELMRGKTTIVIAHRLSTIQKMDRIIVLQNGQIIEEGTHKELLERSGIYAELWNHQTGGFME